jgi:hypothetical protein
MPKDVKGFGHEDPFLLRTATVWNKVFPEPSLDQFYHLPDLQVFDLISIENAAVNIFLLQVILGLFGLEPVEDLITVWGFHSQSCHVVPSDKLSVVVILMLLEITLLSHVAPLGAAFLFRKRTHQDGDEGNLNILVYLERRVKRLKVASYSSLFALLILFCQEGPLRSQIFLGKLAVEHYHPSPTVYHSTNCILQLTLEFAHLVDWGKDLERSLAKFLIINVGVAVKEFATAETIRVSQSLALNFW